MATTEIPAYLKECVGICVICGEHAILSHDGRCPDCWDDDLKPPKIPDGWDRGNGSRDEIIFDMANSHIPHGVIAMKFGLKKSMIKHIVHKMRERRRVRCQGAG